MSGIAYGKLSAKAYEQTFGEAPAKAPRAIYYRGCRGGYIKVYPGTEGLAALRAGDTPKLEEMRILLTSLIEADMCPEMVPMYPLHIIFRGNRTDPHIDVMGDAIVAPSSSY